jgi:c-di-GMP-binding flagellar brake protein YcgR
MTRPETNHQYEKVTLRPRIIALLKRFMGRHTTLSVSLAHSNEEYTSAIIKIDADEETLVLDELKPQRGHQLFLDVKQCTVEGYQKGEGINFKTQLLDSGTDNNIAFYKVALPQPIYHYTQRSNYRAPVPTTEDIAIFIQTPDQTVIEGEVKDISLGGVGFRLPRTDFTEQISPGTHIESCRIRLNFGESIRSTLEVRFARVDKDHNSVKIGARFCDLDKQYEKTLERFIIALDRERMKRPH